MVTYVDSNFPLESVLSSMTKRERSRRDGVPKASHSEGQSAVGIRNLLDTHLPSPCMVSDTMVMTEGPKGDKL